MAKMNSWIGILVMALVLGMTVLVGCASAPPMAFETAESLEKTGWARGIDTLIIMNGKTTGFLLDKDNKTTQFTYTAVYDTSNRSFAGTINLEDGRVVEFTVRKAGLLGWTLTAKSLDQNGFQYSTEERLEDIRRQRGVREEIVKRYGDEFLGLNNKTFKRGNENIFIEYNTIYGLHQTNPGSAMQFVRTGFKLHSKDGVTMTLLSMNTSTHQYAGVDGVGTFEIRISGDTVTISNGAGAGATFNGTWKEHR